MPYLRGGAPVGKNVDPADLDPASNPGVVVDDWVCSSGRTDNNCGIWAGISLVLGRRPYGLPIERPTAVMNLLASSIIHYILRVRLLPRLFLLHHRGRLLRTFCPGSRPYLVLIL